MHTMLASYFVYILNNTQSNLKLIILNLEQAKTIYWKRVAFTSITLSFFHCQRFGNL